MEQFNYCLVVGQTDVGRKRAANEDNMGNAVTKNGLVSVVCDGMGGHVGGATASKIAVNAILENLNTNYYDDPRIAIGESIDIANQSILDEASIHPELTGMGSTCVLLIVRNGKVYIGHVGDSRIYLIRSRRIVQLTKDHSYVQILVDRGEITKEQAEHHPRKNEITNALGIPNMSPATVADDAIIPEAGDCFLLCSDGLSGMVPDATINKVVSRQSEMNAQERVDRLISIANENGGVDNITAQMVEFTISPESIKPDNKFPMWLKILVSIIVMAAVGIGTYFWIKSKKDNVGGDNPQESVINAVADTTYVTIANSVKYKANTEIIKLTYKDSSLIFERDGKQVYKDDYSLNLGALTVTPSCVEFVTRGDVRVLRFTDVVPEKDIVIHIPVNGSQRVCGYVITIAHSITEPAAPQISGSKESSKDSGSKSVSVKKEPIKLDLGEFKLSKDTKLIFNYSAKPFFKINEKEFPINDVMIDEINNDNVIFEKSCWDKDFKPEIHQLHFTFNGATPKSSKLKFSIPCCLKESTEEIKLEVTLSVTVDDGNVEGQNKSHEGTVGDGSNPDNPDLKFV